MNNGNALGFVGLGTTMWLLPLLIPAWFPHVAIDGSSTRALWVQVMGVVQCGIGLWFMARQAWQTLVSTHLPAAEEPMAQGSADWAADVIGHAALAHNFAAATPARRMAMPAPVSAFAAAPASAGSVTLHGEQAALWRALTRAVPPEQLAEVAGMRAPAIAGRPVHPFATAVFRHHPRHSLVHLSHPGLARGAKSRVRQGTPEIRQPESTQTWDAGLEALERAA